MSFVESLSCVQCGRRFAEGQANTCPLCGPDEGILEVHFDLPAAGRTLTAAALQRRPRTHWRYAEVLPVEQGPASGLEAIGWTPLIEAPRLASAVGVARLRLKDDGRNASASFKDRASSIGVTRAAAAGFTDVACASTGNAASSLAQCAAAAGLKANIFVSESVPEGKLIQLLAYGARVFKLRGTYAQAYDLCSAACATFGWYNRNAAINPYLVEGKKSAGLELAEQCGSTAPQWVAISVGDGCSIAGVHKGLQTMQQLGLVEWSARILGVQAAGVAPIAEAFRTGALDRRGTGHTYADSINVPVPRNWRKAVSAVRDSDGSFVTVTDDDIRAAVRSTARLAGIFAEPAAATAVAGLAAARTRGLIPADASVVAMITGNGLKDPAGARSAVGEPHVIAPDLGEVERIIERESHQHRSHPMGIVIKNGLLLDIDPPGVARDELRIDGERIVARGCSIEPAPGDEVVDANDCVVLPGLVNGHTHLYSALATGMPPPPQAPANFLEILQRVWWRLDQALDAEAIEMSAHVGALQALRGGTTTLIDHHASPSHIAGSLDLIEAGLAAVGLRGVLCYETTDRHGPDGREQGLLENERYLFKYREQRSQRFAGLVGAHAAFTLEDDALRELAELAERFGCGVHIHVAEDLCDEDFCAEQHQVALIDRLANHGLLRSEAVFAHCTHLDDDAVGRVNAAGLTVAHNARSNMNNAVGYAPLAYYRCPVMLGTDGIGQDMFAEASAAWLISRHCHAGLGPQDIVALLAAAARRASQALDITLGQLHIDAAADILITDYRPSTPLTSDNVAGHVIFGLHAGFVRDVIAAGRWALRDRRVQHVDEDALHQQAATTAAELWKRMTTAERR